MYHKKQRIAALVGIILLVLLYLATLICAIFNFDGTGRLFQACLFATIAIPLLIWVYIWLFGIINHKRTMASILSEKDYALLQKAQNMQNTSEDTKLETLKKEFPKKKNS